jgi:hypothetical protein
MFLKELLDQEGYQPIADHKLESFRIALSVRKLKLSTLPAAMVSF